MAGKIPHAASFVTPLQNRVDIHPIRRRKGAIRLPDADNDGTIFLHKTGKMTTHIAQSLHHHAFARQIVRKASGLDQIRMAEEFS